MRNRVSQHDFAAMCAQMTRKEIAERLGITIWSVVHYEQKFKCRPQRAHRRPSRQKFAALAERHTKAEVARILGVSYAAVMTWEKSYGINCRAAPRGRHKGQVLYETQPYRMCWLVQGGMWSDMRQCAGG